MSAPLCALADLEDPGSLGLTVEIEGLPTAILLVRRGGEVFGYVNSCPHIGAPLDWQAGQFLDPEKRFILCANHGALFDIATGQGLSGPCLRKRLTPYAVTVREGMVYCGS